MDYENILIFLVQDRDFWKNKKNVTLFVFRAFKFLLFSSRPIQLCNIRFAVQYAYSIMKFIIYIGWHYSSVVNRSQYTSHITIKHSNEDKWSGWIIRECPWRIAATVRSSWDTIGRSKRDKWNGIEVSWVIHRVYHSHPIKIARLIEQEYFFPCPRAMRISLSFL